MTKTKMKPGERKIRRQITALRAERREWFQGRRNPWDLPWCAGPGAPYHQEPVCEGCACREWGQEQAAPITEEIWHLEASLPAVVVQEVLW